MAVVYKFLWIQIYPTQEKMKQPKLLLRPKSGNKSRIAVMRAIVEYMWGDEEEQKRREKYMQFLRIEREANPYGLFKIEWKKR